MASSERAALTPRQAAERLNVSTATVYRWIADGVLPSLKVRQVVRIRPEAIESLLAGEPR
ncbi:helix-turn-helix domain-containing protein [Mycolicibacterium porcinum]|uniref:helix-turn-helix domain-containing protein n=1 Tax=Mycolicibacterium porcinum TaxID=39693 RepID=UPI0009F648F5